MTIEIILAAVITFAIAFFLIDITMKLSSTTDDAYSDTVLITDKALIIKNIKENLENDICAYGSINNVSCNNNVCNITMSDIQSTNSFTALSYTTDLSETSLLSNEIELDFVPLVSSNTVRLEVDRNKIIYSGTNSYSKEIDSSLSDIKITSGTFNGYYYFKISGTNIFVDENYDMNIFVYNGCR